jgi:hypothetical protein
MLGGAPGRVPTVVWAKASPTGSITAAPTPACLNSNGFRAPLNQRLRAHCVTSRRARGHLNPPLTSLSPDVEDEVVFNAVASGLRFLARHARTRDRAAAGGMATAHSTVWPVDPDYPAWLFHNSGFRDDHGRPQPKPDSQPAWQARSGTPWPAADLPATTSRQTQAAGQMRSN